MNNDKIKAFESGIKKLKPNDTSNIQAQIAYCGGSRVNVSEEVRLDNKERALEYGSLSDFV